MIRVRHGRLEDARTEAVLRPVRSDLAALTPASRQLEVAAGATVMDRLAALGEVPVGGAVVTPGGDLAAAFIIHVVLESVDEPISGVTVQRGLENGLRRARELAFESVSLPPLGTGAGNLDPEQSAVLLVAALAEHLEGRSPPSELEIVVDSTYDEELYSRAAQAQPGPTPAVAEDRAGEADR